MCPWQLNKRPAANGCATCNGESALLQWMAISIASLGDAVPLHLLMAVSTMALYGPHRGRAGQDYKHTARWIEMSRLEYFPN